MTPRARAALVLLVVIAGVAVLAIVSTGGVEPIEPTEAARGDAPETVGGFGALGAGGDGRPPSVHATASAHDAGARSADGGAPAVELAAIDLAPAVPPPSTSAPVLPASVTFPAPRTAEDEYESATMVWGMVEMRRAEVRAQLVEARRIGDQVAITRLERQARLLELGNTRIEGIVHDLDTRRGETTPAPPTQEDEGGEGAAPE